LAPCAGRGREAVPHAGRHRRGDVRVGDGTGGDHRRRRPSGRSCRRPRTGRRPPVRAGATLYRIEFHRAPGGDPRAELAADAELDQADVVAISTRLDRLDRASRHGPWTRTTLELIRDRPATRAADLAASVDREMQPFKIDVRKLKNLGLTESLDIGYRLSPRGGAYLASTTSS